MLRRSVITQARPDNNSVVAFKDNSSAIRGFNVKPLLPLNPGGPSALAPQPRDWDLLLTAETHNFPCAVAPYPGVLGVCLWGCECVCLVRYVCFTRVCVYMFTIHLSTQGVWFGHGQTLQDRLSAHTIFLLY